MCLGCVKKKKQTENMPWVVWVRMAVQLIRCTKMSEEDVEHNKQGKVNPRFLSEDSDAAKFKK